MNLAIVVGLIFVLIALATAGYFMVRGGDEHLVGDSAEQAAKKRGRMAKALTVRIAVSVLLFAAVLLAWYMGWIKPGGLPIGR